jgi:hypothetical protein
MIYYLTLSLDPASSTFYPIEEIYGMMKGKSTEKRAKTRAERR